MTGFQSKRMATDRWVNHDIHRIGKHQPKVEPVKTMKNELPYPTREQVREKFDLINGVLVRRKRYGKEWGVGIAGTVNPKCGKRYVRVGEKQCRVEKLIEIYNGEE